MMSKTYDTMTLTELVDEFSTMADVIQSTLTELETLEAKSMPHLKMAMLLVERHKAWEQLYDYTDTVTSKRHFDTDDILTATKKAEQLQPTVKSIKERMKKVEASLA